MSWVCSTCASGRVQGILGPLDLQDFQEGSSGSES